jgi:hypothetical protein
MQRLKSFRLQPRLSCLAASVASALLLPCVPAMAADNPAEVLELPTIEVVGTTPMPGIGTPLKDVPANVQIHTSKDLAKQRQTNVTDYLEQNPTSVTINSGQGNPFQPDINFRGFTASPLLGTPQGISVFQDGVRVNEPFGDVVNWDLIPQSAISSIQLIPDPIRPSASILWAVRSRSTPRAEPVSRRCGQRRAVPSGARRQNSSTAARTASSTIFSPATISTTRAGPTTIEPGETVLQQAGLAGREERMWTLR